MLGEKRQPMPTAIRINAPLGQTRDLAGAHLSPEQRQRDAEALGDDGRIDPNGVILEFNRLHGLRLWSLVMRNAAPMPF